MVASLTDEHGADEIVRLCDELHHEVFNELGPERVLAVVEPWLPAHVQPFLCSKWNERAV
jgi:hypothetical protein